MPNRKRIIQLAEEFGIGPFKKRQRLDSPALTDVFAETKPAENVRLVFSASDAAKNGFHYASVRNWDGIQRLVQFTSWENADQPSGYGWADKETVWTGPESRCKYAMNCRKSQTVSIFEKGGDEMIIPANRLYLKHFSGIDLDAYKDIPAATFRLP